MASTIRNPVEWGAEQIKAASRHLGLVGETLAGEEAGAHPVLPQIRQITLDDLQEVLKLGMADFAACRTDVAFLCIIYPIAGLCLSWFALDRDLLPLLFPVVSGFALVGPVAAVGLYEMSRRRERGEKANWASAFGVIASPSFGAIFVLGLLLVVVFVVWVLMAHGIYNATLGPEPPASIGAFAHDVLTTAAGWEMIAVGVLVGFVFAVITLSASAVSFPLLLDRKVGIPVAIMTSVRAVARNPWTFAVWGMIVTGGLVIGSLPVFLGLIVVMPVLGHATWHLYRRVVSPPEKG